MHRHIPPRLFFIASILLVSSLATAAEVRISKSAPPPGTTITYTMASELNFNIQLTMGENKQTKKIAQTERKKKKVLVIASQGQEITKARMTYVEAVTSEMEGGKAKPPNRSPIVGKTYVVEAIDGRVVVKNEQGLDPPKEEVKLVLEDNKDFGKPDKLLHLIPDGPIRTGQRIELSSKLAKEILGTGAKSDVQVTRADLTLRKIEKVNGMEAAVFDLTIQLGAEKLGMAINLSGRVTVATKGGWPLAAKLKGPVEFSTPTGQGPPGMGIGGGGTMAFGATYTYER